MVKESFLNYLKELPNFFSLFMYSFLVVATSNILIEVSNELNIDPENFNLIVTFFFIGVIAGQIIYLYMSYRLSKSTLFTISTFCAMFILLLLSLVRVLWLFYFLYFLAGIFLGILLIVANSSLVEGKIPNKDSAISLGHSFFAMGAISSPFVTSIVVNNQLNWRTIYYVMAVFLFAINILNLILNRGEKVKRYEYQGFTRMVRTLKNRFKNNFIILTSVMILLYVYSETVFFSWMPTFLRLEKAFDLFNAGLIISIFYTGVLMGRLLVSFLAHRVNVDLILLFLAILSMISVTAIIFSTSSIVIFAGALFAGLGFSGLFPLFTSTGCMVYGSNRGLIMNFLLIIAVFMNAATPFSVKIITGYNDNLSVIVMIIFFALLVMLIIIRWMYDRKHSCREML